MCGRYFIEDSDETMAQIIEALNRRGLTQETGVKLRGEVFPTDTVPVIANSKRLLPMPFAMTWGYTLGGRRIINARSETARERPLFSEGMASRRLLIPATNYFEWEKRGARKVKHALSLRQGRMLYMAGLYRMEAGKPVFTILTRDSAPDIAYIHPRMPVILPEEAAKDWLNLRYDPQAVLEAAVRSGIVEARMPS